MGGAEQQHLPLSAPTTPHLILQASLRCLSCVAIRHSRRAHATCQWSGQLRFWSQILIFLLGGLGSILASVGLQLWTSVAASGLVALTTFRTAMRVDSVYATHLKVARDLEDVRAKWRALPDEQRKKQARMDELVSRCEKILLGATVQVSKGTS